METILPLILFAITTSITPGPNVLMIASGAARHGLRAVWPMMLGVTLGFAVMLLLVSLGLAAPLAASPLLQRVLQWLGAAWLCWLAWKIAAAPVSAPSLAEKPVLGFWGMAAFQWINPKAWLIALAVLPSYAVPGVPLPAMSALIMLVFLAVSLPCLLVWALLGQQMRRLLEVPARARLFNRAMGLLLVLSLLPGLLASF